MRSRIARLRGEIAKHKLLSQVLVLFSGSALSQLVMMVLTVYLLKRYSPADVGLLGLYTAVVGLALSVAAWRYDMAVMLPKTDAQAKQVFRLAARILLLMSVLTSVVCTLGADAIARHYNEPRLKFWMPFTGLSVLSLGGITLVVFWFNRRQEYKPIALNRIVQSTSVSVTQIGLSFTSLRGAAGLIVGTLLGQFLALGTLLRRARTLFTLSTKDEPSLRDMMRRYKRMPLVNGPNAIVDAIRDNGITLLIGTVALGEVGYYTTTQRFLGIPLALINGAVSQVFFQRFTELRPGEMSRFVKQSVVRSVAVGIVPFALLWLAGPWLFVTFIGPQWQPAGMMVRALIPWLFMTLITSPISTLFIVAERQGLLLAFSVLYTVVPLGILWANPWPFTTTLAVMSGAMAVLLIGMTLMALHVARTVDASAADGEREDSEADKGAAPTDTGDTAADAPAGAERGDADAAAPADTADVAKPSAAPPPGEGTAR
ncbi:lipopolysaccharide biosynthesis protein [Buchananella hordeovulneris]|uniref:lipopolysaccharide biosynthesis protein n=1 Tax=Buchananella hordeovulneris TaxID=52770 RepID=UPI000F5FADC0|nr:oligosaccharide flippase family protein [Buchananella hordeovulneris]RRD53518.1 lipopolysaccharide biosynthesis protein [Buchananella hordeovulneris]